MAFCNIRSTGFVHFANFLLLLASAAHGAPRLAFERNDGTVWVANLDGTGAKKIAAGVYPDISPDGTKLAFNTEEKSPVRHIKVVDLATGAATVFKNVPSDNAFGPVWAPDGKELLFYILIKDDWDLALANADGSAFRILKAGGPNSQMYCSACWMPDGRSLYCQDMTTLYHIGRDGAVIKQWPLQKLFTAGDMDSSTHFDVSPDGTTLLVDLNGGAEVTRKGWDGPAPEVWAMDLGTEKTRKLTPPFWWAPRWISNEEYLCISEGAREKQPSIYRVSLDGKTRKLVVKNASNPSASR